MDDSNSLIGDLVKMIVNHNKKIGDLITILQTPTPIKITRTFTSDGNGQIGGGLVGGISAFPLDIFAAPTSHEVWVNRFSITSPGYSPRAALQQGELMITGSHSSEPIFWTPFLTAAPLLVLPVQFSGQGRLSAPHLNAGEKMQVVGDNLPAGTIVRFDMQMVLVTGVSPDAPKSLDELSSIMGTLGSEIELSS